MAKENKLFLVYPAFLSGLFASLSPGILSLAAHATRDFPNIAVNIWDERLRGEFDPSRVENALVGISAMTAQVPRAKRIAERAREAGAYAVIFGGMHPSVRPQDFANDGSVVRGEIEGGSFFQVLSDYMNGRELAREYHVPPVPLINLPLAPAEFYQHALRGSDDQISTSRGCPLQCSYCSIHVVSGHKIRHRPVDEIIIELKTRGLLDDRHPRQVSFTDDAFGFMPQDRQLLQRIIKELDGRKWTWVSQVGMRPLIDQTLLKLIDSIGTAKLVIGVESPFRRGLAAEKNGIANVDPLPIFETLRTYPNIRTRLLLMLGFDFEPRDVFEQMLSFIKRIQPDGVYLSILTPFPGTQIAARLEAENRITERNWALYDTRHLVFERRYQRDGRHLSVMPHAKFMAGFNWLLQESALAIKQWSRFQNEGQVL